MWPGAGLVVCSGCQSSTPAHMSALNDPDHHNRLANHIVEMHLNLPPPLRTNHVVAMDITKFRRSSSVALLMQV